jgi:hypothetical protein
MMMLPVSSEAEIIAVSDNVEAQAKWLPASCSLHRSFRPGLPDDYTSYMTQMFNEGAEMAILHVADVVQCVAVYRCYHTTFHGFRFYVDDLVTDEAQRGRAALGAPC